MQWHILRGWTASGTCWMITFKALHAGLPGLRMRSARPNGDAWLDYGTISASSHHVGRRTYVRAQHPEPSPDHRQATHLQGLAGRPRQTSCPCFSRSRVIMAVSLKAVP